MTLFLPLWMHQTNQWCKIASLKKEKTKLCFFHWVLYALSPFSGQKETFQFYLWCHGCAVYFGLWILHYGSEIHKIKLFHNFSVGLKVRELGEKGIHIQILPLLLILQNFPVCPAQWQTVFSPTRENKETRMFWHYSTAGFFPFPCHHLSSLELQNSIAQLYPLNITHFHSQLHHYYIHSFRYTVQIITCCLCFPFLWRSELCGHKENTANMHLFYIGAVSLMKAVGVLFPITQTCSATEGFTS